MNPARPCFNIWGQGSISAKNTHWNDIVFDECQKILKLDTNKQNQSWNFYRYPPGFIRCNQIIRLQSAEVAVVMISLHVQAKYRRHDTWWNKHKIEPKHVYIRLEILSNTHLSVKSIQMDIFRQQIP